MRKIENKQVVIAVGVIFNDKGKMLLTQRFDPEKITHLKWQFPGGGVEYDEDPHKALEREIQEEIGIKVQPIVKHPLVFTHTYKDYDAQIIALVYPALYKSGTINISGDDETSDVGWFDLDEIQLDNCLPMVHDMIKESIPIYNKYRNK